jgi:hypothetical protein
MTSTFEYDIGAYNKGILRLFVTKTLENLSLEKFCESHPSSVLQRQNTTRKFTKQNKTTFPNGLEVEVDFEGGRPDGSGPTPRLAVVVRQTRLDELINL